MKASTGSVQPQVHQQEHDQRSDDHNGNGADGSCYDLGDGVIPNPQGGAARIGVFQTLRQAILRGELKPGERLMEIQLANKLGVSRTPIREAIRKLELEGLVLMIPRKGAEVAEITEKNLRDVLEVRCALEELAVQLACDRMDEEGVRELRAAAETFESILNSDDITQIAQADVAFHDIIYAATDNRRLIQLLNNLREQMYRYRIEYLKKKECYPQLLNEHQTIIDAIAGHDKELATKFTSQHIKNQAETVVGTIREKEENA